MPHGRSKGRVLVIDDDVGMQVLLSDVLSSFGFEVECFPDAVGALKSVTVCDHKIGAIICDLNMPRISGLEFLKIMQKMNVGIPVILITAFGTKKTANAAQDLGAFGYLSKPFSLSEISDLLERAVSACSG